MRGCTSVDDYVEHHSDWRPLLTKLRAILVASELEETVKWGGPCYTVDGKNVVGMGAFKEHVAIWFHQGVFLSDPDGVLENAQEGKTRALRQWRLRSVRDVRVRRVRAYVDEAIANQRGGRAIAPQRKAEVDAPPELARALGKRKALREAFDALTPGRRREYAEHVASAKRAETRAARVAKILPLIEAGVGLNDRYRGC